MISERELTTYGAVLSPPYSRCQNELPDDHTGAAHAARVVRRGENSRPAWHHAQHLKKSPLTRELRGFVLRRPAARLKPALPQAAIRKTIAADL